MKHKEDSMKKLLGAVVKGTKPWNSDYNVGLVVEQAPLTESFKIMWMTHKNNIVLDQKNLMSKVVYTWEHPTSVSILSRNECHG
jgi:hypothetical protein